MNWRDNSPKHKFLYKFKIKFDNELKMMVIPPLNDSKKKKQGQHEFLYWFTIKFDKEFEDDCFPPLNDSKREIVT